MSKRGRISGLFSLIGSAISVAGAVEGNRAPKNADLRALGIDPTEFGKIARH